MLQEQQNVITKVVRTNGKKVLEQKVVKSCKNKS